MNNQIGHNSRASDVGGVAGERLKSFIERIENLEEEKAVMAQDIKEVYSELKGVGYCAKTVRRMIQLRKKDRDALAEETELLRLYATAVGDQYAFSIF